MRRTLAIVGGGPRALGALERLLAHGEALASLASVDVFSDDGTLGPGWVYATDQPAELRLNVSSRAVTVWPDGDGPSLDSWRRQHISDAGRPAGFARPSTIPRDGEATDALRDEFPPRSLVGRYLQDQADDVLARLRRRVPVTLHRVAITRMLGEPDAWSVAGAAGATYGPFSDVLLALGHQRDWPGALHHQWSGRAPLQEAVFPVGNLLERPELHNGASVVIRGAGLTALDAVLVLTARFTDVRITLVSRSGRPMHPKTPLDADALAGCSAIVGGRSAVRGGADVHEVLVRTALQLAANAGDVDSHLTPASDPAGELTRATARLDDAAEVLAADAAQAELARAVAVACGEAPVTGEWAFGHAWRGLYPALVERQAELPPECPLLGDERFGAWARELERWAFGPPLGSAQALLGLMRSGTVRLRGGTLIADGSLPDLVIDAVLPPPGARRAIRDSLLGRLVDDGLLQAAPHTGGAVVGASGALPDAPGLWLVGRASEGVVLGNDTLIRTLHPTLDNWAAAMAKKGAACSR